MPLASSGFRQVKDQLVQLVVFAFSLPQRLYIYKRHLTGAAFNDEMPDVSDFLFYFFNTVQNVGWAPHDRASPRTGHRHHETHSVKTANGSPLTCNK